MHTTQRRRFLKTAAVATGGLLLPTTLLRAQGGNEKIRVAILGAGTRGKNHLAGWAGDPRSDVVMIVDPDRTRADQLCDAAEKLQGFRPQAVQDMRQAFDSKDVDAISSATPNHWHALSGIWAMQSGKDAYIEKPVCHNITEGTALIAAARKYSRICQVGTQMRSHPGGRNGVEFVHSGGIGEVKFARGLCYNRRKSINAKGDYAIPEEVDFNLWSGPAEFTNPKVTRQQFHYDWHWQRHYGNGDLGNQGPHQTDIARWGLGIDTHPHSVIAYGGRLGYPSERKDPTFVDAGDTANTVVSVFDYGDKCIVFETRGLDAKASDDAELNRLFRTKGSKVGVVFYGSEGYLVSRSDETYVAYDKDFKVIQEFDGGEKHYGKYLGHYSNFLDACVSRNTDDLNADVREGHLSAAISHLGNISYYLGESHKVSIDETATVLSKVKSLDDNGQTLARTAAHLKANGVDLGSTPISVGPLLKFDPVKETFPDSPEANEMLSRVYREGFVVPTADQV